MGERRFYISYELLARLLELPGDAQITMVTTEQDDVYHRVERAVFYVRHSDLPAVAEGGQPGLFDLSTWLYGKNG